MGGGLVLEAVGRGVSTTLLILLIAGCTDAGAEGAGGAREAVVTDPSSGAEPGAPTASSSDHEAERQAKLAHREPGTTEVVAIDWSDVASHPRVDVAQLPAEARDASQDASLPVLLPREPALLAGAVITTGPTWYAAALPGDAHRVTIHGRKTVVHRPDLAAEVPEDRRRQPGELSLTRTHGIVTGAFDAFGASYTMDVECDAPTADARCTEDTYVRSLFERLAVAGGTP